MPGPRQLHDENDTQNPLMNRNWIPALGWVAAAAVVLLTFFSLRQTQRMQRELNAVRSRLYAQRVENKALHADQQLYQRALAILSAPHTQAIVLKPSQPGLLELHAYWNRELGLLVSGRAIPFPASDRAYQVWVTPQRGSPLRAGTFRPNAAGEALHVFAPQAAMTDATALAITEEPADGRSQATTQPLWVAPVR